MSVEPIANSYRAEVQKFYPHRAPNEPFQAGNTILGISLGSPAIKGSKIVAIFEFIYRRGASPINLFIGDGLYRYTAMIKYQCDLTEATEIAKQEGKKLIEYYEHSLKEQQGNYQLNYLLTSDFIKEKACEQLFTKLWQYYSESQAFHQTVANFADEYLSRIGNEMMRVDSQLLYDCACKYLIEELAMFAELNKRGINNYIYPGTIRTICDILLTEDPFLQSLFAGYTFISLRLKRRKSIRQG